MNRKQSKRQFIQYIPDISCVIHQIDISSIFIPPKIEIEIDISNVFIPLKNISKIDPPQKKDISGITPFYISNADCKYFLKI